tara:strand:+ start:350 stop:799 length:450 start_codon:yes stop_codon:yes gene_type:complete
MRFLFMYGIVLCLGLACLSSGCSSSTTALNLITPDRLGLGQSEGTMSMAGKSNGWMDGYWDNGGYGSGGGQQGGYMESDHRLDGESQATMIWLEWDFPQWNSNPFQSKEDRYMKERIRHLNYRLGIMEAENKNNQLVDDWLGRKTHEGQ